eukprot:47891-Eustigmatos_ZCMA.PRE.1
MCGNYTRPHYTYHADPSKAPNRQHTTGKRPFPCDAYPSDPYLHNFTHGGCKKGKKGRRHGCTAH